MEKSRLCPFLKFLMIRGHQTFRSAMRPRLFHSSKHIQSQQNRSYSNTLASAPHQPYVGMSSHLLF
jgi:hypothetical protein